MWETREIMLIILASAIGITIGVILEYQWGIYSEIDKILCRMFFKHQHPHFKHK